MKKLITLILFPLISFSQGGVMITEIADPNDNASARYVEIYNSGSDQSMSDYYLLRWTNGSGTSQNTAISLATACGSTLYRFQYCIISSDTESNFAGYYGIYSDDRGGTGGSVDSNGDDNIAIVTSAGGSFNSASYTLIDVFGNAGEDGTGTWHEFENGRVERKSSVQNPVANWNQQNDWNVDGDNGNGAGARNVNQDFDPGRWIGSNDVDTWIGGTSGDWSVGSNWGSGSVPTTDERVWIRQLDGSNNALELGSGNSAGNTYTIPKLYIYSGGAMTINKDGALTVTGEVTNNGTLTIQSDSDESGSLIAKSASTPSITYNNYIFSAQWKLIGLPVTGEVVNDIDDNLLSSGSKSAIGYYDNDKAGGAGWVTFNTGSTSGTELVNTRGYEIRAASSPGTVSFTGTMLNSDLTNVAITTESSPGSNWNLVGNPYPSYVRMTDDSGDTTNNFLKVNASAIDDTAEAVYGWDGTSYDIYDHDDDASGRPDLIAPGTGFFIYAASDTNVSFTEAMQVHSGGIGFHGSLANGSESQRSAKVTIRMHDEFLSKNLRILFNDKSSIGLDRGGDIRAFPFGESHIYMQLLEGYQNVDFAKQSLPYEKISDIIIPIGIETPGSTMVLNFVENTLPEYIDMYLEDTQENTFKKITDGFEINFDEAYEGLGRFYLHFTDQLIPELPTDDNLRIYKGSDADVMVMGAVGKNYSAKVYDYSGRLIKEINFNHKTKINDLDSKMKILRIESEEGLTIKKFKLN